MVIPNGLFEQRTRQRNQMAVSVDLFAGGGGASEGIRLATGKAPILAVNHNPAAIAMHAANHPETEHRCESVFEVDPRDAIAGQPIDLLWASPDCTHFSRAKGGKPREKKIRGLAWVIVKWAEAIAPPILAMENVPEFVTWGPLDEAGKPIKARKGEDFQRFVAQLEALGYTVAWKVLNAADFGAPTSRKRLFLVARRDGKPIVWPVPSHGKGRPLPYRTAAECIDWSQPICSIFATPTEARAWAKRHKRKLPKRPLKPATQRRIAEGLRRFVLDTPTPFLVRYNGDNAGVPRTESIHAPLPTVTSENRFALVTPTLVNLTHGVRFEPVDEPMRTITAAHRGEKALLAPMLAKAHSHGWDRNGGPIQPADRPMWTVTAKAGNALVVPTLMANNTNNAPHSVEEPLGTITTGDRHYLVSSALVNTRNGERKGQAPRVGDIQAPMGTVTAQGSQGGIVSAYLSKHYTGVTGQSLDQPIGTVTAVDHHSLATVHLTKLYGTSTAADVGDPAPTITGQGGHLGLVAAHLQRDFGASVGSRVDAPAPTITAGGGGHTAVVTSEVAPVDTIDDRAAEVAAFLSKHLGRDFGDRVIVVIGGEEYVIVDIAMRMLQPEELKLAQGFDASYILTGTKEQQVARLGNSVCPPVVLALIRALLGTYDGLEEREAA